MFEYWRHYYEGFGTNLNAAEFASKRRWEASEIYGIQYNMRESDNANNREQFSTYIVNRHWDAFLPIEQYPRHSYAWNCREVVAPLTPSENLAEGGLEPLTIESILPLSYPHTSNRAQLKITERLRSDSSEIYQGIMDNRTRLQETISRNVEESNPLHQKTISDIRYTNDWR